MFAPMGLSLETSGSIKFDSSGASTNIQLPMAPTRADAEQFVQTQITTGCPPGLVMSAGKCVTPCPDGTPPNTSLGCKQPMIVLPTKPLARPDGASIAAAREGAKLQAAAYAASMRKLVDGAYATGLTQIRQSAATAQRAEAESRCRAQGKTYSATTGKCESLPALISDAAASAAQTAIHKEQGPTPAGIPTWVWLAGGAVALGGAYLLLKKW